MGQITSSVGIISGIPTADLIDQLLALEARPKELEQKRSAILTSQQVAFQQINAQILGLKLSADQLANINTFRATTASSSNESALTVTSKSSAVPGTYDFVVNQLVTTQQMVTSGFADTDTTLIAPSGDTLTFEFGDGRLDSNTQLDQLNASSGVTRGKIRITDRSGAVGIIDLSTATTVDEVLQSINAASSVSVTASVQGDHFVITDNTGQTTSSLSITDTGSTTTASDLGIATTAAGSTLTGSDINTVGTDTLLSILNDGNGIGFNTGSADFRVTLRDASTFDVNLTTATTLGDVIDTINAASGANATAAINAAGTGIQITDNTAGATTTVVTALNSSKAAADLGILISDYDSNSVIEGDRLVAGLNSKLIKNLRGGQGVTNNFALAPQILEPSTLLSNLFNGAGTGSNGSPTVTDLRISPRNTVSITNVIVDDLNTVQDLIDRIDTTFGGNLTLTIEGDALRMTDNTGGATDLIILDSNGGTVATTLGIYANGPVSTVLGVNLDPARLPTQAYGPGQISVTNSAGTATEIDLTAVRSVSDLIQTINDSGAGLNVALNDAGNGLIATDTAGGTGSLIIADVGGGIATELGLAGTHTTKTVDTGDLDVQYLSEATRLDNIRNGLGVTEGKFIITDSSGASATVDLTQGDENTIADVLGEINSRGLQINARINDTGDGILIEDTGPGVIALKIEESGSTTAADLGLLREATNPGDDLIGSFETTITVEATDTLDDIVSKINSAGIDVKATIINDGSQANPYRLNLLASQSGRAGQFVFDNGNLDFSTTTLVEAEDAKVFFGSSNPAQGIAITSSTNTIDSVIPGATIDLKGTSPTSVQVVIGHDNQAAADEVQSFVDDFNSLIDTLNKYDKYDAENETRGLLLGDGTVARVRNSLYRLVNSVNTDVSSQFNALVQAGVTVGSGAKLEFDSSKFFSALDTDRNAVEKMFTLRTTETDPDTNEITVTASGFAIDFSDLLKGMSDANGSVQTRIDSLDSLKKLSADRITQLDAQLESKRLRLQSEFTAMELALANMQSQGNALASLSSLSQRSYN